MIRQWVLGSALALLAVSDLHALETKYVAVVSVLTTTGEIQHNFIVGTEKGVSLVECNLRLDVWRDEHEDGYNAAQEQLKAQGKFSSHSSSCERKD